MPSNDRPLQKPSSARGNGRKNGASPLPINTTQDQSIRDTQYPDEEYLLMEDDPYASNPPRPPSSAIRLNPPVTRRSSRDTSSEVRRLSPNPNVPARRTQKQGAGPLPGTAPVRPGRNVITAYDAPPVRKQERRNIHWLFYVGLGMLASLTLWALGATALAWGTNEYNNVVYGYPRTYQTDAVVGHNNDSRNNPSHFIAINLHGQIVIIELPAGDPTKSIDYILSDQLTGSGDDLYPVTLTFSDFNHDGKVDMLVHIDGQTYSFL